MNELVKFEIFTDYICPWCYICLPNVERLQKAYPIQVCWIYYPLHPDVPPDGSQLPPGYQAYQAELAKAAAEAGLPFTPRSHRCNSQRAQELGKWGFEQPGGERLHQLLYRAYFAENLDIWNIDVLVAIAERSGLDGQVARRILVEGRYANAVAEDWARAEREGISGVPTFFHEMVRIVGAQPYSTLENFVLRLLDR